MGRLAKGAMENNAKVLGVIPEFMINLELGNEDITELRIVKDMHERQAIMMKESDFIVTLPGGSGSMLEFFEAISWKRLGLIISPIVLVNLAGYYDHLLEMLDKSISEKFMTKEYGNLWKTAFSIEETVDILKAFDK